MKIISALALGLVLALAQPPAASALPINWTVFFAKESAALPPDGEVVVNRALQNAIATGATQIEIVGHTDSVEPRAMELSQQRADAVKAYLISRGVPATITVATSGVGSSDPTVPGGGSRALNRYVTVRTH